MSVGLLFPKNPLRVELVKPTKPFEFSLSKEHFGEETLDVARSLTRAEVNRLRTVLNSSTPRTAYEVNDNHPDLQFTAFNVLTRLAKAKLLVQTPENPTSRNLSLTLGCEPVYFSRKRIASILDRERFFEPRAKDRTIEVGLGPSATIDYDHLKSLPTLERRERVTLDYIMKSEKKGRSEYECKLNLFHATGDDHNTVLVIAALEKRGLIEAVDYRKYCATDLGRGITKYLDLVSKASK